MPRLDRLAPMARDRLLTHNVLVYDDAPWTQPAKPLSEMRVAVVTTGGFNVRGDTPFKGGDQTFRVIPADTPARDILLSHSSIGFDRAGVLRDLNLILPIDRLREMSDYGEIGGIGPNHYSFMGAQTKYDRLIGETGPEVGRRLKDEGVDAVLLTGA
ncbi:MAG TPA: glycine/sarcosine/betaine reductase selenoprotein B family protein [Chloroflexota bacterium]|nr:glycine/sarcosine/betaine reductase selenoprotein B family protein [Chloroflexota bacterium]